MSKPTKIQTSFRFRKDFLDRLREHAEADEQSMSDLIWRICSHWMDGRRYSPTSSPVDPATRERQAKANAPYKRPRGRPMTADEAARDDKLTMPLIKQRLSPADEGTISELMLIIYPDGAAPNTDRMLAKNLYLAGWRQALRTSDGALVWLGPEHPALPTLA